MSSAYPLTTDTRRLDGESATWLARLQPGSQGYDAGVKDLHVLLLKAARFEVHRRRAALGHLGDSDHEDLVQQSADDALMAVLRKLSDFRGESRFTTWAYKFALLEAAVKVRRRAWQGREVQLEPESWSTIADRLQTPHEDLESRELIGAIQQAIEHDLTPHQRQVLVAITLNEVPIDVLAERLVAPAEPSIRRSTMPGEAPRDACPPRPRHRPIYGRRIVVSTPIEPEDLLGRLLGPAGPELTCEECFDQLDRYVELELAQAKADEQVPGMRAHLQGCPACNEDHESLLALVASEG